MSMSDDDRVAQLHEMLGRLQRELQEKKIAQFHRRVSFGDLVTDRWENARAYGFGAGSSCYDTALILGDVKVGRETWIGPGVVLDGSGGLRIGDFCSISAGVQIYSHHTVRWANSCGVIEPDRKSTSIGNGVYVGPNSIVQMGVTVGDRCVIGAMSLVNRDVPAGMRAWGTPARVIGPAEIYPSRRDST